MKPAGIIRATPTAEGTTKIATSMKYDAARRGSDATTMPSGTTHFPFDDKEEEVTSSVGDVGRHPSR
jgi:hypothetical protein